MSKTSAASRTIDLFQPPKPEAQDDAEEERRKFEPIEVSAERWRATAMFTAEHYSKHFNDGDPGKAVFRLTEKDSMLFLEQFKHGKDGQSYHWSGLMFHKDDLAELTNVFVKAWRDRNK